MPRPRQMTCQCGGTIPVPLPPECPHCGAKIVGVQRRGGGWLFPLLLVAGIFAALVAALLFLVRP